ncbi:Stk1 family PASTA domain-containing Ser/Thr kinase [Zhaonella formicivorans]|uniref:Stk1 family PASTA domain-containing Ser/Thr kinase n=1 Tax=Zhaonella formicivorans TaxID=2528593 RepID=UPI0010E98590|nr:Stk1 family PASTA domain-containing Ser/Thr kinase [Zhaonella formicivorans]
MIGKTLGNRYEIAEKIGGGGMAVVYKGKDKLLNRAVTIKVLREQFVSEEDFIKRFRREAQAVASLSHPNIVSIYDVGHEEDFHYLVMEYVEGQNLKEIIQKRAPVEPLEAIDYLIQIMDALEHAHDNKVVHRDIKPHNILVTKGGKVKVTDFGIAQAISSATVTYTGTMVGSVQYISPEQAKGEVTGVQADIYSAGVVLYELLTGRLPFEGDTAIGIALKHIQSDFVPPSELVTGIPPALERIVLKAMAKEPEMRYQSAREMRAALEKVRFSLAGELPTQVLPAIEDAPGTKKSKSGKKRPKPVFWFLLPVFLLVALAGFWLGMERFFEVGESEVPNVVGKSLADAEAILSQAKLKYQVEEKVYHPSLPAGYVVKQSPEAGKPVKRTRPVILVLSLGPELKPVPGVLGEPERTARITLTNAGFNVAEQVEEVYDEEIEAGRVVAQNPEPEVKKPLGTEVTLTVSLGPEPKNIPMPKLVGERLEDARRILEENRLELGNVTNEISYEFFSGQVMWQSVPEGQNILQGQKVDVKVSKGPGLAPETRNVEILVADDGKEHHIQVIVSDVTGTHEEYNAWHNPGDFVIVPIEFYGKGILKVLQDDKEIHREAVP